MSDETRATDRPATFREVFASREYRGIFAASGLSWFGDYLTRAAVTALVFERTSSVALSAATFALSFLPWIVIGPLLTTLADRYRYRSVMVLCDLVRMVAVALVALPDMPVWGMLVLLFITALGNPPAQAARSALLPLILSGDRLVVGLAVNTTSGQAAQVGGYLAGAAMAPFFPELALLINAATFGLSALLIKIFVRDRPPVHAPERRHLLRETADGFSLVFGTPVLRAIAVLVFSSTLFAIVPEGLAAAWAAEVSATDAERGFNQGLIMAANPLGFILGGLLISRLVSPSRRQRLVRPFALLAPASLVPALLHPSAPWVAVMAAVCGFSIAGMMPTANGLFVQALPHGYRARAFGVMQSGLQITQGLAVLGTGLLADAYPLPTVVGLWSLAGVGLLLVASAWWPSPQRFAQTIAAARQASPPADGVDAGDRASTGPPAPSGEAFGSGEPTPGAGRAPVPPLPYPPPVPERHGATDGHGARPPRSGTNVGGGNAGGPASGGPNAAGAHRPGRGDPARTHHGGGPASRAGRMEA